MPRLDRAFGHYHSKRAGGGGSRRTRKRGKNTYAAKQGRPATFEGARHGGATPPKNQPKPQAPKGPKGGSKGGKPSGK